MSSIFHCIRSRFVCILSLNKQLDNILDTLITTISEYEERKQKIKTTKFTRPYLNGVRIFGVRNISHE